MFIIEIIYFLLKHSDTYPIIILSTCIHFNTVTKYIVEFLAFFRTRSAGILQPMYSISSPETSFVSPTADLQ